MKHQTGDRVSRKVFMDDGTWAKHGDKCLRHSPLRYGTVLGRDPEREEDAIIVLFDDGKQSRFLDHGVERVGNAID